MVHCSKSALRITIGYRYDGLMKMIQHPDPIVKVAIMDSIVMDIQELCRPSIKESFFGHL